MAGQPAATRRGPARRRANEEEPGRGERGEPSGILYLSINPRDNACPPPPDPVINYVVFSVFPIMHAIFSPP